jgi:DEAD/DEAH box helicase domain-containing protein
MTLRLLLLRDPLPERRKVGDLPAEAAAIEDPAPLPETPTAHRVIFFDLETQRSAAEVGGWHNAHLMRMALAVIYDTQTEQFETFFERDVHRLIERLGEADLVVGFNVISFDYAVLRGYTDADLSTLPTFDMLAAIHQRLGYRLALGHLAEETLGASKGGDGLQSLAWWKEGRVDEIERYCRQDVSLLVDLLRHASEHGHLCFRTKRGDRVRLPAAWQIPELVERAHARPAEATREADRRRPRTGSQRKRPSGKTDRTTAPRTSG